MCSFLAAVRSIASSATSPRCSGITAHQTPDQVIAELEVIPGWLARGGLLVDDNFIGNKRALREELLPALIQWQKGRRGTAFYTEASINLADDAWLMRLMVEAGFNKVFVGIETPEEAGLAERNKRQNQKRNLIADVKRIQHAGLEVQAGSSLDSTPTPPRFLRDRSSSSRKAALSRRWSAYCKPYPVPSFTSGEMARAA